MIRYAFAFFFLLVAACDCGGSLCYETCEAECADGELRPDNQGYATCFRQCTAAYSRRFGEGSDEDCDFVVQVPPSSYDAGRPDSGECWMTCRCEYPEDPSEACQTCLRRCP